MKKIRHTATEEGKTLKEIINRALERGLAGSASSEKKRTRYKLPAFHLGPPSTSLDKALSIADQLETEGVLSKLELRK